MPILRPIRHSWERRATMRGFPRLAPRTCPPNEFDGAGRSMALPVSKMPANAIAERRRALDEIGCVFRPGLDPQRHGGLSFFRGEHPLTQRHCSPELLRSRRSNTSSSKLVASLELQCECGEGCGTLRLVSWLFRKSPRHAYRYFRNIFQIVLGRRRNGP